MTCPECGRWAPPDRETGYDVDEVCPECQYIEAVNERQMFYERQTLEECQAAFRRALQGTE